MEDVVQQVIVDEKCMLCYSWCFRFEIQTTL